MARLTTADLEINRKDEPFEYETEDGKIYELRDPKRIHAKILAVLESLPIEDQLRQIIGDKADEFLDRPDVDGYLFEALMSHYRSHFGLGGPGEAPASPRS